MNQDHHILSEFSLHTIIPFNLFGYNLDITNSTVFMFLAAFVAFVFFAFAFHKKSLIPSRVQLCAEIIHNMIIDMLDNNVGKEGQKFAPLIFSTFIFVLLCNLIGNMPYAFMVTAHVITTFSVAIVLYVAFTIFALYKRGIKFFALFLPHGTPIWLAPLMIVTEFLTFLSKPISLTLRLAANMIAGEILLIVLAGFAVSLVFVVKILPISLLVLVIIFELGVAVLQAYIFTMLSCVYLGSMLSEEH
ncbi:MAG: F0F1 ATP synthase subunit A [Rickettsiaceae bacterium]